MELHSTQFLVTLVVECNQSYEKVVVDSISVRFLFLFSPWDISENIHTKTDYELFCEVQKANVGRALPNGRFNSKSLYNCSYKKCN